MSHSAAVTYLHDHLSGSRGALDLVEYLERHAEDPAIRFDATRLRSEFESERILLEGLVRELGGGSTPLLKEASAWMGEKLSRLNLGALRGPVTGLPLFEAVEALVLGVRGKMALWDALAAVAGEDPGFPRRDFPSLREQARDQCARLEAHRVRLARGVLVSA